MIRYAVVFAVLFAMPFAAQAVTYDCDIATSGRGGFIGERFIFQIDPASGEATVLDGLIQLVYKKPIAASTKRRSDTSWRLRWHVRNIQLQNDGSAEAKFSAVLNEATMKVNINSQLLGYDNNLSGRGTCKIVK